MAVSFNDDSVIPDNFYTYSNFLRDFKTPIVIDNGNKLANKKSFTYFFNLTN